MTKASTRSNGRARGEELGAGEILLTSMDTDGVQTGFDCPLTQAVRDATQHSRDRLRRRGQAGGFLRGAGRQARAPMPRSRRPIFHYGTYTVGDLKTFLARTRQSPVRP